MTLQLLNSEFIYQENLIFFFISAIYFEVVKKFIWFWVISAVATAITEPCSENFTVRSRFQPAPAGSSQLQPVPASSSWFQPAPDGSCSWCYSINNHFTEFLWRNETYHFSKYNFSFKGTCLFYLLLTKISPVPAGSSWFQLVPVGGCSWCYLIKKLVTEFL